MVLEVLELESAEVVSLVLEELVEEVVPLVLVVAAGAGSEVVVDCSALVVD